MFCVLTLYLFEMMQLTITFDRNSNNEVDNKSLTVAYNILKPFDCKKLWKLTMKVFSVLIQITIKAGRCKFVKTMVFTGNREQGNYNSYLT